MRKRNFRRHKANKSEVIQQDLIKDTALIITLLTGLSYFFSLIYQKGFKDFYGINDIASSSLDINTIVNSFYDLSTILIKICVTYLIISFLLKFVIYLDKEYDTDRVQLELKLKVNVITILINLFLISFILFGLPLMILGLDHEAYSTFHITLYGGILILILCFAISLRLSKILDIKPMELHIVIAQALTSNIFKSIWDKSIWSTRIALIILLGFALSLAFYEYGYTKAQQKEDYTLVNLKKRDYILLNKEQEWLIIASIKEINGVKTINKNNLKLVKLKGKGNIYNFENISLKGGLQVLPNKRKDSLKGVERFLKVILFEK